MSGINSYPFMPGMGNIAENKTQGFAGGSGTTSGTINTYTTVLNIASGGAIVTGLTFNSAAGGTYTIKITIDGTPYTIPMYVYSSGNSVQFSFPCIIKCNTSFKVEIAATVASLGYNYAIAYGI